ncbi:MAG: trypsin-like peptidase domain-containing protein [Acidobacteria bacterium]|nr:trypsin-like peptidase domain-containing protein [Acidobacteriota bacterium]
MNLSISTLFRTIAPLIIPGLMQAQPTWPTVVESTSRAIVVVETDVSQGSGFFVNANGTLITNHHVIEGANQLAVRTAFGEVFRGGFVIAADKARDLAIIRVEAFDVPVIKLGNSNEMKVGAFVLLMGAPRGLEQSASDGIVSALRTDADGMRLIQTSASASPGSSGGPLLNEVGEAVGVLSFTVTQSQNLNFAVPINYARGILDRITAVASQPVARLEALRSTGSTGRPVVRAETTPAPELGGIYVTGFGPTEYLQQVYLELTEVLAQGGVRVVELREVNSSGNMTSVSGIVRAAKEAKADGVLYFALSTGWGQTDRLKVQCYDQTGRLVWKEETTSMWQASINAAVGAVTKRMQDKLRKRIQKQQFPGHLKEPQR